MCAQDVRKQEQSDTQRPNLRMKSGAGGRAPISGPVVPLAPGQAPGKEIVAMEGMDDVKPRAELGTERADGMSGCKPVRPAAK